MNDLEKEFDKIEENVKFLQGKLKDKEDNTSRVLELSVTINSAERELQTLNNDINDAQIDLNENQIAATMIGHYIIRMEDALFNMHEEVRDYVEHVNNIDSYIIYRVILKI